jgi:hypothetical protein
MLFMEKDSVVIEIRRDFRSHMLSFFHTMADFCGHQYYFSLGAIDPKSNLQHEVREEEKSIFADLEMLKAVLKQVHDKI